MALPMARPLVSDAPTIGSTVRFSPKEWGAIDVEAEKRGLSRAGVLREGLRAIGVLDLPEAS